MNILKTSIAFALSALFLSACGTETAKTAKVADTETVAADLPVYNVAIVPGLEPYAFRGENRKFEGFNIDLMNAIAEVEGFTPQYMEERWSSNFEFIQSGNTDILGSIVIITPERSNLVDFSESYIESSIDLATTAELENTPFDTIVNDDSLIFGAMEDTRLESYGLETISNKDNMIPTNSQYSSVADVFSGKVNASFVDGNSLRYYKQQYPDLNIVHNSHDTSKLGFVVKKGNSELQEKLNSGLQKIHSNGTYDSIYTKWFGKEIK